MALWLNEHDIDDLLHRYGHGDTPNLLAGAKTLDRLRRWTNDNSDGWPYWQKPSRAAVKLMTLLTNVDRFDPQDCTEAQLQATYTPIRSFLTREGFGHDAVFPVPRRRAPRVFTLPHGIEVTVDGDSGTIQSDLHQRLEGAEGDFDVLDGAYHGIESLILAHAVAGIDIMSAAYVEGVETAVEAATNNLTFPSF